MTKQAPGRASGRVRSVGVAAVMVASLLGGAACGGSPSAQDVATDSPLGTTDATTQSLGAGRLTEPRSALPDFPPTPELEAIAGGVPVDARDVLPEDRWAAVTHPVLRPAGTSTFPVFTADASLAGIYVSGIGVIARDTYDDPDVDLEAVAQDRWGEEYDAQLELRTG